MRSARDRRSRRSSEASRPQSSRSSSITDDAVSPSASFSDGFEAFLRGRRSSSGSQPGTPVKPSTPTFQRSFDTLLGSEDEEEFLPTVSKLASPERRWRRHSGGSISEQQREQVKRPGRKARKKLLRGPVTRPKNEDVLEKATTSKLTKFWAFVGVREYDSPSSGLQSPAPEGVDTGGVLPIFPDPQSGSFHVGLPSIAEDPSPRRPKDTTAAMDSLLLAPGSFEGPNKQRQIQDAKDMYQTVVRNAERSTSAVPPYDFIELIGKGGYGRVYKCRKQATGELVAVKIINIDDADFQEHVLDKDNTINSFRKEVGILQQLKDSKAKNVNMIHEAFDLHSQLWIVSDYCTGGSLRTLMRANPPTRRGFEEQFLVPIARELAIAIKSVHDIGVIHRDIKCANVYVSEEGDIQLGDFGIVGDVDDGSSKRRTIVGTPHYLPREMHVSSSHLTDEAYGTEVDIWSYGITIFEAATGLPPYANISQSQFHTVIDKAPRLEGGDYSDELREFIAFCLNSDPKERPSASSVLKHPYVANSSKRYPTSGLVNLIERYAAWEYKGGQRQSLWAGGGAAAPVVINEDEVVSGEDDEHDWNFSTSDSFNLAFGKRYSTMIGAKDFSEPQYDAPHGAGLPPLITKDLTPFEQFEQQHKEMSANRGERSLDRLFQPDTTPYELHTPVDDPEPMSDLPLRNMAGTAPARESVIDLDSAAGFDLDVPTFNFDFGDVPTLKAKTARQDDREVEEEEEYQYGGNDERRATLEWKFPTLEKSDEKKRATMDWTFSSAEPTEPDVPDASMNLPTAGSEGLPPGFRPTLKHTATEPIGQFRDFIHPAQPVLPTSSSPMRDSVRSMIDLDMSFADPADIIRPSTASSATGSTMTDMTSGNPFDLEEDPEQNELDRNRFSYHKQWQSEGGPVKRLSHKTMPMHSRGSSLNSTDSELDRLAQNAAADDVFDYDYSRNVSDAMRTQMGLHTPQDSTDISHWPNFGSDSGLDESPQYPSTYAPRLGDPDYSLQQGLRTNGLSAHSFSRLRDPSRDRGAPREIEFVEPIAPHPEALLEDADPQLVAAELDRLLDDFGQSLKATSRAMRQHTGIHQEEASSGTDSGFDSSTAPTGDEDGF
ncbi:hypothetical protein LTR36_002998 [Oleoguttula mirabilis]|uniref:non-specific serine/threonine protein kinase n=1 Tax=Oleoguttula mirabilis TaxID=1507867 RepID=A0AAV9JY59_9PEZI|nr:hypothetical protein LTR36_002998 [Oleoguttula mirabilis]